MGLKRVRGRENRAGSAALVLVVWLGGALVFFRAQWRSGWNLVMGNDGDGRLQVYLNEHWFQVFHGKASWLNPPFFYPVRGLLGWSDTFFLYQVFYSPLRLFGADPFLAMQLTIVLLSLVGFASFYGLARLGFGSGRPLALTLALAFVFSNQLWLHAGSFQDNGVWLVPLVALCGVAAWDAAGEGRHLRSGLLGFACGGLAIMLVYSTFYVGYFSFISGVILLVAALAVGRARFVRAVLTGVVRRWPAVVCAAAGFGIGLGAFIATYLAAQRESPADNYAIALAYAGRLRDVINIGGGNVIWSSVIHSAVHRVNLHSTELTYAPTPALWMAALGGGILCAWWLWSGRTANPVAARAAVVLAITAVIMALVPLHTQHLTMWAVIHHLPGAKAMRAIDRAQIVTGLLAFLAAAAAATELFERVAWSEVRRYRSHRTSRRWLFYPAMTVLGLIVVEQLNTSDTSLVSRRVQNALLASVRAAPPGCRTFFVIDSQDSHRRFFEYQIDAMLVSQKLSLPTINGYTAYNPTGWDLEHPGEPGYLDAVDTWTTSRRISTGLCQLDLAAMTWARAGGS